jgi:hypothetical protein
MGCFLEQLPVFVFYPHEAATSVAAPCPQFTDLAFFFVVFGYVFAFVFDG